MMSVCILTPGQIGSNPRVVKEADALHEAGWRVSVIATRVLDQVEARDQSLMTRISWKLVRLDLRSKLLWRLHRIRQFAARRGFEATGLGSLADRGFSPFTPSLTAAALRTSADVYIAHYPAALPAAVAAARRHSARYAYDAEDFHLGDWPDRPSFEMERRFVREIEGRRLPGCSHVTAASPGIANAYAETYSIPQPKTVLNVFPRGNAPPLPTPCGIARPGPSLYWFSQTVGAGRGLETAVEAIARAQSRPHLYLRGAPARGYEGELRALAQRAGVGDRLHILKPDAPDEMERLGAQYDLGYVGELAETQSRQIALTNKLFSYLLSGVPSLASDIAAHRALAPDLGEAMTLFPVGDPTALAGALDRLLMNADRLAVARAHAWRLGQERYCWEVEQRALLNAVGERSSCRE